MPLYTYSTSAKVAGSITFFALVSASRGTKKASPHVRMTTVNEYDHLNAKRNPTPIPPSLTHAYIQRHEVLRMLASDAC